MIAAINDGIFDLVNIRPGAVIRLLPGENIEVIKRADFNTSFRFLRESFFKNKRLDGLDDEPHGLALLVELAP